MANLIVNNFSDYVRIYLPDVGVVRVRSLPDDSTLIIEVEPSSESVKMFQDTLGLSLRIRMEGVEHDPFKG